MTKLDDEIALLSPDYYITLGETSGSVCSPTTGSGTLNSNTGGGHNLDPGTSIVETVNPLPCQRLEEAGGSNNDWLTSSGFSLNLMGLGQAFTLVFVTEFEKVYDAFTDSNPVFINLYSSTQTNNYIRIKLQSSSQVGSEEPEQLIIEGQHSDGVNTRNEWCSYIVGDNPNMGHIWAIRFDGSTFENARVYKNGIEFVQNNSNNDAGTAGYTATIDRLYVNTMDGVTASDNRITIRNIAIWRSELSSDNIRTLALDGVGVAPDQVEIARQAPDYYWPLQNRQQNMISYRPAGGGNDGYPLTASDTGATIEYDYQFAIDNSGEPVYRHGAKFRKSGNRFVTTRTILSGWDNVIDFSPTNLSILIEFVPFGIFDFAGNETGHAELVLLDTASGASNDSHIGIHLIENTGTSWPFHFRVTAEYGSYYAELDFPCAAEIPFDSTDATVAMVTISDIGVLPLTSTTCKVYINNVEIFDDQGYNDGDPISVPEPFGRFYVCSYGSTGNPSDVEADVRNIALFDKIWTPTERNEIYSAMQGFDGKLRETVSVSAANADTPTEFLRLPESIAETLSSVDDVTEKSKYTLSETITVTEAVSFAYSQIITVADAATATDSLSDVYTMFRTIEETVDASDLMYNTIAALMAEVISNTDSVTVTSDFVNQLAETINATDQVTAVSAIIELVAVAASALDVTNMAFGYGVNETVSATDIVNDLFRYTQLLVDALSNTDSVSELNRAVITVPETIQLADTVTNSQLFGLLLQDAAVFIGVMEQGTEDDQHYTMVTNTKTLGLSEYSGYNFNSISNGLAADSNGIYSLGGTDDNTSSIIPEIITGIMTFDSEEVKGYLTQVTHHYLGLTNNNDLVLQTVVQEKGVKKKRSYILTPTNSALDTRRVKTGKGVKSRYWQFILTSVENTDFELNDWQVLPLKLPRRL